MKKSLFAFLALALFAALDLQLSTLHAQGTAFAYRGRLSNGTNAANGSFDLTFSVWTNATDPAQVGGTLTNPAVAVRNGYFTATLDFGDVFPGADRWLEIGVRSNGVGGFSLLSPRQQFLSTPYAVRAANATSYTGDVTDAQLSQNIARLDANQTFTGSTMMTSAQVTNGAGWTTSDGTNIMLTRYANDTMGPSIQLRKSRGTVNTPAVVLTEDYMGSLDFYGNTGQTNDFVFQSFWPAGSIRLKAVSVPTVDHITSQLRFFVGSVTTPSYLNNIATFAGGDPQPWVNFAAPLYLSHTVDVTPGLTLQEEYSAFPKPICGITGSSQDNAIRFYGNSTERMKIDNFGLFTVTHSLGAKMADFGSSGHNFSVGVDGAGRAWSGTTGPNDYYLASNDTERWTIKSTGHLLAGVDNTYDIGASGDTRPRNVYVGSTVAANNMTTLTLSATNAIFMPTNTFVPSPLSSGGWLWNSNQVLYWVTSTKTNLISDGR